MSSITRISKLILSRAVEVLGDRLVGSTVLQSNIDGFKTEEDELNEFLAASSVLLGVGIANLPAPDGARILKKLYKKFPEKRVKAFLEATTYSTDIQFSRTVDGEFPDLSCTLTSSWRQSKSSGRPKLHE